MREWLTVEVTKGEGVLTTFLICQCGPQQTKCFYYQVGLGLLQKASEFPCEFQVLFQLADALAGMCTESLQHCLCLFREEVIART